MVFMTWLSILAPPALAKFPTLQKLFWVADNGVYRHLSCTDVAAGSHISLFNCGQPELSPRDAGTIIHSFDHQIFPADVSHFGLPRGLKSVEVLMVPFTGMTIGYFNETDLDAAASGGGAHSNHGNVLYVRSLALMPDSNKVADVQEVLAHELQHLIDYRVRVLDRHLAPEELWLNEGLSFFAQLTNGYWTSRDSLRVNASASDPSWSVTSMNENPLFLQQHSRVAYGRAGMFVTYLAMQNGTRFTRALIRDPQTGMAGIDAVLRSERRGTCADAFVRWGVAQLLNAPGQYGYHGILGDHFVPPHLAYPAVTSYPFDTESAGRAPLTLQAWTESYVRFVTAIGFPVTIQITAPPGVRVAAVYGETSTPNDFMVRWLKEGLGHAASISLGGYTQRFNTVTLVISALGSSRANSLERRPATVQIEAASINSRHDKRVARTTSTAGKNADFIL
jgi:hypothetical protein